MRQVSPLRAAAAAFLLAFAAAARGGESLSILALGDAPGGPDADVAELTHQLRAACRDRVAGVQDVPSMRARLLGQTSHATLAELDRAYAGALAVFQNGEFESALRTLRAVVEDLERLPEGDEAYHQWKRAVVRLGHAAVTLERNREGDDAIAKLLMVEPGYQPDPDQYSPTYRRHFDEVRGRVRVRGRRRLTIFAEGRAGTLYVNGRSYGTGPVTLTLPTGRYRIGGSAGSLRVPSFWIDLESEDRAIALDFALAESLRVNAGPGLALGLDKARRAAAVIRAGAWLGADKLVIASRGAEGEAQFLVGAVYDVRRGALLREGRVRMVAGSVPPANLGALAAFLLTGQPSREVQERTPEREVAPAPAVVPAAAAAPSTPSPERQTTATPTPTSTSIATSTTTSPPTPVARPAALTVPPLAVPLAQPREPRPPLARPWMRPAAIGAGVFALGLTALAIQQGRAAADAYADARALETPDGNIASLSKPRFDQLVSRGKAATRNAWLSAGAALIFAGGAGALGWMSFDVAGGAVAMRF